MLPLDLHVLSLPLAFILSQDQTLHCIKNNVLLESWLLNFLKGIWQINTTFLFLSILPVIQRTNLKRAVIFFITFRTAKICNLFQSTKSFFQELLHFLFCSVIRKPDSTFNRATVFLKCGCKGRDYFGICKCFDDFYIEKCIFFSFYIQYLFIYKLKLCSW